MELRCQRGEIKRTKAVRDRLDRRCPPQVAVAPQEVINETFYLPSKAALRRGYAIIQKAGKNISSVKKVKVGDHLGLQLQDGTIGATTTEVTNG